jgi:transcription termination/antitermination protein NusA
MLSELKRIIDQISRDKGIDRELLIEGLEDAVASAARKKFGPLREIEVRYNEQLGEIEVFQFRTVVEQVEDEETQISFEQAEKLDPEVQLNDEIGSKMENIAELGRIAAQSAKQVIIQKMKDAEADVIFEMYKDRKGEVVNGIVQRFERGNVIVNLGRTDAILPSTEQMPRRSYRQGDRIRALLLDVRTGTRDPQLVLSRSSSEFLVKLFTMEVPEIQEGVVRIVNAMREPGSRAKIAVTSSESDVDPVGACVGMKGSRVQNVVQELQGEKIDIVPWSPDPAKYVSNALAPAQVSLVVVDEETKTLQVIVPDDQLSLAIGRQGQNVRLASKLLGWRIDVYSEAKYAKLVEDGYQSLTEIEGIDEKFADLLYENGISSAEELANADLEQLTALEGVTEESAAELESAARRYLAEKKNVEQAEVTGKEQEAKAEAEMEPEQAQEVAEEGTAEKK